MNGTVLYVVWALLLVVQNASFTMVSRARNSGSDLYHGIAAVFSNGIWFAATFITFERIWTVLKTADVGLGLMVGAIYVAATVTGSVLMGWFLRNYVETGKRKVGHYEENAQRIETLEARVTGLSDATKALRNAVAGVGGVLRDIRDAAREEQRRKEVPLEERIRALREGS